MRTNGSQYSVYHITPLPVAGVQIDVLAQNSKFGSQKEDHGGPKVNQSKEKKRKADDPALISKKNKIRKLAGFEPLLMQTQLAF